MADYVLEGVKWGDAQLGSPGGTVTWSFLQFNFASQHWNFDFSLGTDFYADVRRAFDTWESVARIDFIEVGDAEANVIRLGMDAIDGPGNVVGEAIWTQSGGSLLQAEIRFDTTAAENWHFSGNVIVNDGGVQFYAVALHEIGHALGLDHYAGGLAIMNASISSSLSGLTSFDISGVQAIYGAPGATLTDPPPVPPPTFNGVAKVGTSASETIVGNALANYVDGVGGSDYIGGGPGADNLHGGDGNDRMDGHQDADYVSGDAGDDVVYGGDGSDVVVGDVGNDVLVGDIAGTTELGADVLYCGAGNDVGYGGAGNDVIRGDDATGGQGVDWLYGEGGNDILLGFGGADRLFGGQGFDVLFGDAGADVLLGGTENDYLYGGPETDVLLGEQGNDVLDGDGGADYLLGGTGYDTFVLQVGEAHGDVIADFIRGGDVILLQGYGAGATLNNAGGGVFFVSYSGGFETFVTENVTGLTAGADYFFV